MSVVPLGVEACTLIYVVISLSHDVILIVIIGYVNLVVSHDISPLDLYVLDMMCSFADISGVHDDA